MLFLFRIGSKPILIALSFLFAEFFSACSSRSENETVVFKALDESLVNSNLILIRSNEAIYMSLEEKMTDPMTSKKATIWQPKAMVVKMYSSDLAEYIEGLKNKLKKEAGLKKIAGIETFNENDMNSVNTLFNEQGAGKELYEKLKNFKRDILAIDIQMDSAFRQTLTVITKSFDTSNDHQNFTKTFFTNRPVVAALAMLSTLQNNIKINENGMITFCHNKLTGFIHDYTTYSAIVAQSSSYVKAGDEMEITAGIGEFSRSGKPSMTFNGRKVDINESGTAVYKFKTPLRAGKYIVPVKISYIDQEGKEQYIIKNVGYTVFK